MKKRIWLIISLLLLIVEFTPAIAQIRPKPIDYDYLRRTASITGGMQEEQKSFIAIRSCAQFPFRVKLTEGK